MDEVVKKASEYVTELLSNSLPSVYKYHNLKHTRQVVDAVDEIGKCSGITDEQLEMLKISASFHDVIVPDMKAMKIRVSKLPKNFLMIVVILRRKQQQ